MKWHPVDFIIGLLASVVIFVLITSVAGPIITGIPMGDETRENVAELTNALIAIISFYIGSKMKK